MEIEDSLCVGCDYLFVATAKEPGKSQLYTRSVCLKDKAMFDHLWHVAENVFIDKKNDASVPHVVECTHCSQGEFL